MEEQDGEGERRKRKSGQGGRGGVKEGKEGEWGRRESARQVFGVGRMGYGSWLVGKIRVVDGWVGRAHAWLVSIGKPPLCEIRDDLGFGCLGVYMKEDRRRWERGKVWSLVFGRRCLITSFGASFGLLPVLSHTVRCGREMHSGWRLTWFWVWFGRFWHQSCQ
jgi:hypothetical protein